MTLLAKRCSRCKETTTEFHKNRARADGLSVYCKRCRPMADPTRNGTDKQKAWHKSPRGLFNRQKMNAAHRGIEFLLTFEEWMRVWTGKLPSRGRSGYVMARIGDSGPYAVGNVKIITTQENCKEYWASC
jgi:hypothetical protein